MAKKKKTQIGFLVGLILAGVFVVAALMFAFTQYTYEPLLGSTAYNGFTMAFGKDSYRGNMIFIVAFVLSLLAAFVAVLAALRIIKVNSRFLFAICALFALGAAVIYIVEFIYIKDMYTTKILNQYENVKWAIPFWGAFALNVVAFLGSGFGAVSAKK